MEKELIAVLVSTSVSIASAVWALLTASRARRSVLLAEEHAKRAELVRVKALEAIDELLEGITTLLTSVETMCFLLNAGVSIDPSQQLKDFAEARAKVNRLRYRFAPYVSDEVLAMIGQVVQMTSAFSIQGDELEGLASRLRLISRKIASEARAAYLANA